MFDEIVRWIIGDVGLPIIIGIVSILAGFFTGRIYERNKKQKNTAKVKGNKNTISQHNVVNERGDSNGK